MTKIQNNSIQKQEKFIIPYNRYCIDSFKLLIDRDKFSEINIPDNFILVAKDTGEEIREFKKNSIPVTYQNTVIYLGLFRRILNDKKYDKVMILFSAKIDLKAYFEGIKKNHIIDVLQYLKEKGYLNFKDVNEVFSSIYVNDLDIKKDFKFQKADRELIEKYNKELQERFIYEKNEFHKYNTNDNFGIQTFNRERSTITKPFLKFYDKTKELPKKHYDFFMKLPENVRSEITENFIYRYEFTMKNKKFFNKFGLSNKLQDIFEVSNDKWKQVGAYFLNSNFQINLKRKTRDIGNISPTEKILALYFYEDIQKHNLSPLEVKNKYTSIQQNKVQKQRMSKLFDKIYQYTSQDYAKYISDSYESIKFFDKLFGINIR